MHATETFLAESCWKLGPYSLVKALNTAVLVLVGPAAAELMAGNTGKVDAWKVWEGVIRELGGRQMLGPGLGAAAECRSEGRACTCAQEAPDQDSQAVTSTRATGIARRASYGVERQLVLLPQVTQPGEQAGKRIGA